MGGAVSQRRRPQLGADRRRRRLREPAQRRGHRLRPRDRPAGRRDDGRSTTTSPTAWPALLRDALRRVVLDRPPAGRPGHRARGCCRRWARPGMRSDWLMTLALRWMGNLVTDEDRDRAARVWRWAGPALAAPATPVRRSPDAERLVPARTIGAGPGRRDARSLGAQPTRVARRGAPAGHRPGRCWPACTSSYPDFLLRRAGRAGPRAATCGSCAATTSGTSRWSARAMDAMRHVPVDRAGAGRGVPPGAPAARAGRGGRAPSPRPASPTPTRSAR